MTIQLLSIFAVSLVGIGFVAYRLGYRHGKIDGGTRGHARGYAEGHSDGYASGRTDESLDRWRADKARRDARTGRYQHVTRAALRSDRQYKEIAP